MPWHIPGAHKFINVLRRMLIVVSIVHSLDRRSPMLNRPAGIRARKLFLNMWTWTKVWTVNWTVELHSDLRRQLHLANWRMWAHWTDRIHWEYRSILHRTWPRTILDPWNKVFAPPGFQLLGCDQSAQIYNCMAQTYCEVIARPYCMRPIVYINYLRSILYYFLN